MIRSGATHIAIFVAASNVHLRYKLKMSQEEVLTAATRCVRQAKEAGLHVAFVTEDTVRAPFDFVERLYLAVKAEGADRLVIADTVGIMTPLTFRGYASRVPPRVRTHGLVRALSQRLRPCHGQRADRTRGRGNEPARLCQRTRRACGERPAGGASRSRLEHLYGIRTGLDLSRLYELSRLVEEISGFPVSPTKSVVGYNAFSHEAGIHTHGILAHTLTYEPVQPDVIGRQRRMILGKHTGKAALVEKLKERGMELPDPVLVDLLQRLKASAESRSKEELEAFLAEYRRLFEQPGISDEEFWKLVKEMGLGAQTA